MNIAKVIPFPQQQASKPSTEARESMYSDKFQQGYVMSSLLYRKEVYPFLSDAARNVYAELENRINGYNKESDFVSYSQLQGGELPGSRLMSRPTVSIGLKELLKLGVVTVMSSGKQGMKSYQINEISLKDRFSNKTSVVSKLVQQVNQDQCTNETATSVVTTHTIDNSLDNLDINKKKTLPVDNSKSEMFGDSIEYHPDDSNPYSLRELANVYLIKTDFSAQAKIIHPDFTDEQILVEIKNFAQWSTAQQKRTAQAWMNNWIYRIQKFTSPKSKSPVKPKSSPGQKNLSDSQIDVFSKKLCNFDDFASMFSNVGETQKQFESRISKKLRDPENIKSWATYLRDVGFAGNLGDFV